MTMIMVTAAATAIKGRDCLNDFFNKLEKNSEKSS